jgi:PGF-pre-PGF domain-containing protein
MMLRRHHIIAIILALILMLIVLASAPAGGQSLDIPDDDNAYGDYNADSSDDTSDDDDTAQDRDTGDEREGGTDAGCIENWTYHEWSDCINGWQIRTAFDLNGCGTHHNISVLERQCEQEAAGDERNNSGPDSNLPICIEDWDCAEWSDCLGNGYMVRECIDRNGCGTAFSKPVESMPCIYQGGSQEVCSEEWVCTRWSECSEGHKTRSCRDVNECGTSEARPNETRRCRVACKERWLCGEWSGCMEGHQSRICRDIRGCHVENITEFRECEMPAPSPPGPNETLPQENLTNVTPPISPPNETLPQENLTNVTMPPGSQRLNISRIYDEIRPDEPARVIVDEPDIEIRHVSIAVRNTVRDVRLDLKRLGARPAEMPQALASQTGRVYSYIEISKENMTDDDISSATIDFEANKSWIREQGMDALTLRLMRYADGSWAALPTAMVDEDADRFYYQAETPGFSIFAIAGEYMVEKSGVMCIPMDRRCYDEEVQECDLDGMAWTTIEACGFGCITGGTCREAPLAEIPFGPGDYAFMLLVAIITVISLLAFAAVLLRLKRKRAAEDLRGGMGPGA